MQLYIEGEMLPDWNVAGIIPPVFPGASGNDPRRSPYAVSTLDLVERFNFSDERKDILRGLLDFRLALRNIGVVQGVQWIDGSFLEDVESLENRNPNDIDVVTFFSLPSHVTQQEVFNLNPQLFDQQHVKLTYRVDAYFSSLGSPFGLTQLRAVTYWYSMWSHRRNGIWKGFAQIPLLDPTEQDAVAAVSTPQEEGNE